MESTTRDYLNRGFTKVNERVVNHRGIQVEELILTKEEVLKFCLIRRPLESTLIDNKASPVFQADLKITDGMQKREEIWSKLWKELDEYWFPDGENETPVPTPGENGTERG